MQRHPPSLRRIPFLLWPLVLLWRLITLFANAVGILITLLLGLLFMGLGLLFMSTFVGIFIGLPLFALGFLLLIRGLW